MRIVIIQDQLRIGGTEKQSLFLARFFRDHHIDCHLLTFRPGGHLSQADNLDNIPHTCLQNFDTKISLYAPNLIKTLKSLTPDAILCMGRTANCYAAYIQNKLPKSHVIATLRTGKPLFPFHRFSLPRVKSIIVNSNWWERQLLKMNIPQKAIHVSHNSLLLNRPEEERLYLKNVYRTKYQISPNTTLFLNVATFRKGKRHIDLLKSFQSIHQSHPQLHWKLWLVGDGPEFHRCQKWVQSNQLADRIRFFHFQKDPFPFYSAADVAISASREDSLPNFLIEAQASSLPLIAFDCRGVAECCLPDITGKIIPATNLQLFTQAIIHWIQNPNERQQFAKPAAQFAQQKFAPIPQAQKTLEFIQAQTQKA